jgi:hypothetical protein
VILVRVQSIQSKHSYLLLKTSYLFQLKYSCHEADCANPKESSDGCVVADTLADVLSNSCLDRMPCTFSYTVNTAVMNRPKNQ